MIGCILYGGVCFSTREMLNQHLNKKAEAVVAIKAKEQGHLGQIILTSSPNTGSSSSSPCPRTTSSFPQGIFCGFLAGLLGQSASYPFDMGAYFYYVSIKGGGGVSKLSTFFYKEGGGL